jgi:hypothetical protein
MNQEGMPDLVDRVKIVYDGVKQYFLRVVEQEKAEFDAAQNLVRVPGLVLHANDDCPQCHTPASIRAIAAGTLRCFQCGHQNEIRNPNGSPNRAAITTWEDYSDEHKRKFAHGFIEALNRFRK